MLSKILQKPYTGNGNNFGIEQGIFDIPTVINVFSAAHKPTERRSTQTYEDQYPEIKYSGVFPVCQLYVGFSDDGSNLELQCIQ